MNPNPNPNPKSKSTLVRRGGAPVSVVRRVETKDGKDYVSWRISWRELGKPRSTSRSNREEALALADEIATRLGRGEIRQRILTGLELAEYEKAAKLVEEAGGTLLDAARFYSVEWEKREIQEINCPDLVEEFLVAKRQDSLSDRYLDDARLRLKSFSAAFPGSIALIKSRDLDDYLRSLTIALRSRDNVHTILKSLFSYARTRGYLPASERTAAEALRRVKIKPTTIGILTPGEFEKTLAVASPKTLAAFVLGGFCGIRQAEICRLDWSSVSLSRKLVTINASIAKTSRRRLVPLHDAAAAWLAPISKPSGPVIEYSSPINLSIMMRAVWKAAGVRNTQNCLRHSAASYRLADTGDAPRTTLELGTSVKMLMEHYRELVTKEDAEAWFAIFPTTKEPAAEQDHKPGSQDNPSPENDQIA